MFHKHAARQCQSRTGSKGLVTDVSAGLYVPKDPGMLYFQMEYADLQKTPEVFREAFQEIARLQKEGPTAEELERVVTNTESERLYAAQSVDGLAGRLGFLQYVMGDLGFDRDYLERIKKLTAKDVAEVASKDDTPPAVVAWNRDLIHCRTKNMSRIFEHRLELIAKSNRFVIHNRFP